MRTSPILRQLDGPNAFSLVGLAVSFASVILAFRGQFQGAVLLMMAAGLIDLFDGFVARKVSRTPLQSDVGRQLDSIVDVCSFGFAPALFAFAFGLNGVLGTPLLLIFMGCAALRLAYFNATGLAAEGDEHYYTGMPVTYVGLYVPVAFLLSLVLEPGVMRGVLGVVYAGLAVAMVAPFPLKKPRGIWYGIFGGLAAVLTVVYIWAMVQP